MIYGIIFYVISLVKPRIIEDSFNPNLKLKRGQMFTIDIKFVGEPMPTAKWFRGDKVRQYSPGCFSKKFWYFHLI